MNDGRRKRPQKHQNRTAFKITFDTQALEKQKKVSLADLCVRCTQQLQWKLQYNKYKKMTEPSRCNICSQKNVFRTYMTACQPCVQAKNICAKCLTPDYEAPEEVKVPEKVQKQQQRFEYQNQIEFMKSLQQRSRRTVRRNLEKGKISWDQGQKYFVDEEGNKVIGLHFRKGFTIDEDGNEHDEEDDDNMDEGDMFGDEDDEMDENQDQDQDQDQEVSEKKEKNPKKQQQASGDKEQGEQNQEGKESAEDSDENKSDVQGDEVDCENDLDFEDEDDMDDLEEQEQEEEIPQKGKKNKQLHKNVQK